MNFNPRAPCGARPLWIGSAIRFLLFQSTRPMRGATRRGSSHRAARMNFNPRAPCGARRCGDGLDGRLCDFNPRAPCGARQQNEIAKGGSKIFQSTRPMRGATYSDTVVYVRLHISIHAPHAGRDVFRLVQNADTRHFNPRAPCGARRVIAKHGRKSVKFQSTRPMRGATFFGSLSIYLGRFQSTRPMRGATIYDRVLALIKEQFQSTRPMRGATQAALEKHLRDQISIHAPHAGRDPCGAAGRTDPAGISIHAPHAGRDT